MCSDTFAAAQKEIIRNTKCERGWDGYTLDGLVRSAVYGWFTEIQVSEMYDFEINTEVCARS